MRVLLLSEFYPPVAGGTEFHVQGLARELIARGHDAHVATLSPESFDEVVPVHILRNATSSLPWVHESRRRPFHPPTADPVVRAGVGRLLRQLAPDVIHAHNWIAASVPHGASAPVVYTAHDFGLICARRDLFINGSSPCKGPGFRSCLSCASRHYGAVRGPTLAALTVSGRRKLNLAAVIAVSESVAERISPYTPTAPLIIPNFLPNALSSVDVPSSTAMPPPGFVMFAGATGPAKGVETLLEAWDGGAGFDAPLVLAVLSHYPVPASSGATVISLTRPQLVDAWGKASIAVIPSRWAEPCPTVALEAMACGTPIVASAIGGITALIEHDHNGLLVPPGNAQALREAIERLLKDPELRAGLAANAATTVAAFRADRVVPQIEAVYDDAVRSFRAERAPMGS